MSFNIIELFAGIGAQNKALKNIGKPFKVLAMSEWNVDALVTYTSIHEPAGKFSTRNITVSKDGNVPYEKNNFNDIEIKAIKDSIELHNNIGSIFDFSKFYDLKEEVHLMTYSFPCQNISSGSFIHGYNTGIKKGANQRSSLLWEIENVLDHLKKLGTLPKYLMLENVKQLLNKRNKGELNEWLNLLTEKYGYSHCEPVVLNSLDFAIPQSRERVFVVSYLKNMPDIKSLEKVKNQKDIKDIINDTEKKYKSESIKYLMKDTPSRVKMAKLGKNVLERKYCQTISKKQDRWPNAGKVVTNHNVEGYLKERFLTPRECFKLMGFSDDDFEKARSKFTWKESKYPLYAQAGNSIVVNVIEEIFKKIMEVL